jgi:hypothetical protein
MVNLKSVNNKSNLMSVVTKAIEELEYFYKALEEKEAKPSEFTYNLNAFLSRGRSITWIIEKQYSKHPDFSSWYTLRQKEMRNDKLMKFFVEARNISVKEHSINPHFNMTMRHITISREEGEKGEKGLAVPMEGVPYWFKKNEKGEEIRTPTHEFDNRVHRQYYFRDPKPPKTFRDLQAIDLCKIYLDNLKEIADQAINLFEKKQ